MRLADESRLHRAARGAPELPQYPEHLSAAAITGSDAIHPGYGFLAENAAFAEICRACGITFIGPSPEAIRLMGNKAQAREMAKQPRACRWCPGSEGPLARRGRGAGARRLDRISRSSSRRRRAAAAAGMRIVRERAALARAYATCQAEAGAAFGNSELYLEKFVEEPRHVELQVLGRRERHGLHLGERDCSVQRRHQKLLEEAPAPALPPDTRAGLTRRPSRWRTRSTTCRRGRWSSCVDRDGQFYFIEMNTRIQVEHPVTEMITGIDIVREQIRIASGEPLGYKQSAVTFTGHAIECRVNAEDPEHFVPSPGRVTAWIAPGGPGVRVDSHMMTGYVVPPYYDSLIAKIIVHGRDRNEAIARMQRALHETVVEGIKTTIPYHLKLLADPAFVAGGSTLARLEQNL